MLVRWGLLIIFSNLWVANAFAIEEGARRVISACERTVSPQAAVQQDLAAFRIPEDSLAADFIRLVEYGQAIDQMDWRLDAAGLIVPGGGLCTSDCVGAIRLAYLQPYPLDRELAGTHYDNIVEAVKGLSGVFGHDARLGADTEEAHAYFIRQRYHRHIPNSLHMTFSNKIFDYDSFSLPPGSLALLAVDDQGPPGHSVVIAGQIPELRLVLLFDPNDPWGLKVLSYEAANSPPRIVIEGIPSMLKYSYIKKMLTFTRTGIKNYSSAVLEKLAR